MYVAQIVLYQLIEEVHIATDHIGETGPASILLQSPDSPEPHIAFIDIAYLPGYTLLTHEGSYFGEYSIHNAVEALRSVRIDSATWERNEEVTCPHPEPRIASQEVAVCGIGAVIELQGGIQQTASEVLACRA